MHGLWLDDMHLFHGDQLKKRAGDVQLHMPVIGPVVPLIFDCRNNTSPLENPSKAPVAFDSIFQCNSNNSTDLSTGTSSRCQEAHQVHPHPYKLQGISLRFVRQHMSIDKTLRIMSDLPWKIISTTYCSCHVVQNTRCSRRVRTRRWNLVQQPYKIFERKAAPEVDADECINILPIHCLCFIYHTLQYKPFSHARARLTISLFS